MISALIKEQYDLVKANDKHAVCCTNLYGETMELYKDGFLHLPEDVIKIWADNLCLLTSIRTQTTRSTESFSLFAKSIKIFA